MFDFLGMAYTDSDYTVMITVVYNFSTEMHLVGKVMSAFVLLSTTIAQASALNFVRRPPLFERPL